MRFSCDCATNRLSDTGRGFATLATAQFELVSHWRIAAPLVRVWAEILDTDAWPSWWRAVKQVEKLRDGDAAGLGAVRRMTWGTALPYTLAFEVEVTLIQPMHLVEGRASGELNGLGLWTLSEEAGVTVVRYDWRVDLGRPWMRTLAPLLRPAFTWNHAIVMGWGEVDLKRRLGLPST